MSNDDCPCRYCVPPKRTAHCHSTCPEYTKWDKKHQEELEQLRELRRADADASHRTVGGGKKWRKR
jgi:hypothetical protein